MVRDCKHEEIEEMVRDCTHDTRDSQRLQTEYKRCSETANMIQEMVRDCRQNTRDVQRLQT
ncbi:unnamed protein product [Staurois parvus]|uniref:Uncharacterized protein n=1 Tax=Staurois parvus TaxID=386267 RepID=A0ABN9BEV4_9NEOB|nr:unnamed protein product [Staurois parvus]